MSNFSESDSDIQLRLIIKQQVFKVQLNKKQTLLNIILAIKSQNNNLPEYIHAYYKSKLLSPFQKIENIMKQCQSFTFPMEIILEQTTFQQYKWHQQPSYSKFSKKQKSNSQKQSLQNYQVCRHQQQPVQKQSKREKQFSFGHPNIMQKYQISQKQAKNQLQQKERNHLNNNQLIRQQISKQPTEQKKKRERKIVNMDAQQYNIFAPGFPDQLSINTKKSKKNKKQTKDPKKNIQKKQKIIKQKSKEKQQINPLNYQITKKYQKQALNNGSQINNKKLKNDYFCTIKIQYTQQNMNKSATWYNEKCNPNNTLIDIINKHKSQRSEIGDVGDTKISISNDYLNTQLKNLPDNWKRIINQTTYEIFIKMNAQFPGG